MKGGGAGPERRRGQSYYLFDLKDGRVITIRLRRSIKMNLEIDLIVVVVAVVGVKNGLNKPEVVDVNIFELKIIIIIIIINGAGRGGVTFTGLFVFGGGCDVTGRKSRGGGGRKGGGEDDRATINS